MPDPIRYLEAQPPPGFAAIVGAVLHCVGGHTAPVAPLASIPSGDWEDLATALHEHRLVPSVAVAVKEGWIEASPLNTDALDAEAAVSVAARMRITAAAEAAAAMLAEQGVESRILKGIATGVLDHRNPAIRKTSDVDLLVRERDFERAAATLVGAGWTSHDNGQPADLLVERTFATPGDVEIDLHHRLFRFGRGPELELFDRPERITGTELWTLPVEGRLLHACAHLLLSPPGHRQASSLLDVEVLRQRPDVDRDVLDRLAQRVGVADIVRFAEWLAAAIGGSGEPAPTVAKSLLNRAHLRVDRRIDLETLALLRDMRTIGDRLRYVRYQLRRRR